MGKLIGTALILTGCMGFLVSWYDRHRRRQRTLEAFLRLLVSWESCLEREKMRLSDFLEHYVSHEPQMEEFLAQLGEAIAQRRCPTGEELWREALLCRRRVLELDEELLELLLPAGGAFFGRSRRESIQCAGAVRERIAARLSQERAEFAKKQKVYVPVGMLGGVLLVILFL